MTGKQLDRLVAAGVFLYALVLYVLTMAETSPFWDSGEFIAISNGLEVSHPPGAPFYMLVGRLFAMAAPLFSAFSPEPVAFAVNLVSVLSSAATVLLTHLVIVRLVRSWLGAPEAWAGWQRVAALGGGAIGALTFAVTDSFWFNAVEAEVYGMSMLFTAAVVWFALVWAERTRAEEGAIRARGDHPFGLHADRLLIAIAYLFGLAIGVHLLNVLALFFVALIVYYEKVERPEWTPGKNVLMMGATGLVAAVIFVAIYPGVVQWLPTMAAALGSPLAFLFLVVAALTAAVWWTHKNHRPIANLIALSATVIVLGYSSYAVIFIRSAADPPIDENDPETAEAIVSYLKREQFGNTPLLRGTNYDTPVTYAANGQPIQRDELFPRRHSVDPSHVSVYRQYSGDLDYFMRYQLGHMFGRYFMWQFAGKAGDTQDSGWIAFPWQKSDAPNLTPSERAGQNAYWALPLLLGLIGFAFHTQRDWRRSLAVGVLFLISGVGIIVYLNQTPMQPRERDYSYVGAFFAFSLWIGIGATGLIQLTAEALKNNAALQKMAPLAVALLAFIAVPGWMAVENYDDHDRSGRRIATDFAVNMLESTAPNAILFTNGDNDTFPLWYAQEVLGIRRDVRVVNLSLLNTDWYIRQLKNQDSRTSARLPFTITDRDIDLLGSDRPSGPLAPGAFDPRDVSLPVDRDALFNEMLAGSGDTTGVSDAMTWRLNGRPLGDGRSLLYTADLAVLDILKANAENGWERPIYFASTVGPDSELGLQPFFQNEGLARRVVPIERPGVGPDGYVVPEIASQRLANFKFDGLSDPDVYLDQNARAMADSYRRTVGSLAAGLAAADRGAEARALLARIDEEIPATTVPASFASLYTLAEAYTLLEDQAGLERVLLSAQPEVLGRARTARTAEDMERAAQYAQLLVASYASAQAYEAAAAFTERFAEASGDPGWAMSAESIQQLVESPPPPPPAPTAAPSDNAVPTDVSSPGGPAPQGAPINVPTAPAGG